MTMTALRPLPDQSPELVRDEIARATARLSRFRAVRDRAQLRRLEASPRLKEAIAQLLRAPLPA